MHSQSLEELHQKTPTVRIRCTAVRDTIAVCRADAPLDVADGGVFSPVRCNSLFSLIVDVPDAADGVSPPSIA